MRKVMAAAVARSAVGVTAPEVTAPEVEFRHRSLRREEVAERLPGTKTT